MLMKANKYKGLRKEHPKGLKENMELVREVNLVLDLKDFLCLLLEWIV